MNFQFAGLEVIGQLYWVCHLLLACICAKVHVTYFDANEVGIWNVLIDIIEVDDSGESVGEGVERVSKFKILGYKSP